MKAQTVTCPEVSPLTTAVTVPPNPPTAAVGAVIMCYCLLLYVEQLPFTADTQAAMCPNVTVMQRGFRKPLSKSAEYYSY